MGPPMDPYDMYPPYRTPPPPPQQYARIHDEYDHERSYDRAKIGEGTRSRHSFDDGMNAESSSSSITTPLMFEKDVQEDVGEVEE